MLFAKQNDSQIGFKNQNHQIKGVSMCILFRESITKTQQLNLSTQTRTNYLKSSES